MVKQVLRQRYQAAPPNAGALSPELFPEPPQPQAASAGRVAVRALLSVSRWQQGPVVLLLRIAGRSPVTTIWAEDRTVFLVQALASPRLSVRLLRRLPAAAPADYRAIGGVPAAARGGRRIRYFRCGDRLRGGAIRFPRKRRAHSLRRGCAGCSRRRSCCFRSRRLRSPTAASTPRGISCSRFSGPRSDRELVGHLHRRVDRVRRRPHVGRGVRDLQPAAPGRLDDLFVLAVHQRRDRAGRGHPGRHRLARWARGGRPDRPGPSRAAPSRGLFPLARSAAWPARR